jgi:hypothetical protein
MKGRDLLAGAGKDLTAEQINKLLDERDRRSEQDSTPRKEDGSVTRSLQDAPDDPYSKLLLD